MQLRAPIPDPYDHYVLWRGITAHYKLYEALVEPSSVKVAKNVS
jgi:hypothetical protein